MIVMRPAKFPEDEALIYSSWKESYSHSRWATQFRRPLYFYLQGLIIRDLLARAAVLVACAEDDPDVIVGWSCTGPGDVVHYGWVKARFRGNGIARALLAPFEGRAVVCTHAQQEYDRMRGEWVPRVPAGWRFDPEMMVKGKVAA